MNEVEGGCLSSMSEIPCKREQELVHPEPEIRVGELVSLFLKGDVDKKGFMGFDRDVLKLGKHGLGRFDEAGQCYLEGFGGLPEGEGNGVEPTSRHFRSDFSLGLGKGQVAREPEEILRSHLEGGRPEPKSDILPSRPDHLGQVGHTNQVGIGFQGDAPDLGLDLVERKIEAPVAACGKVGNPDLGEPVSGLLP